MNFEQSSYEVMEDRGEVEVTIELSKTTSKPFEVIISLMDDTANSEY